MSTIGERVHKIEQIIASAAEQSQRSASDVLLMAVSKGQSVNAIREAYNAGIRHVGENYVQEAQAKIHALKNRPLCWHFIGAIQSNKTQAIARNFSWVHSVSHEKTAQLLSKYRPLDLPELNLCLQVNLDQEETKSGIVQQQLYKLVAEVSQLPRVKLRGLMAIPKRQSGEERQYESLQRFTKLLDQLNEELDLTLDTLSMGMSEDFLAAIRAGSTIVRVGRAIFGERPNREVSRL